MDMTPGHKQWKKFTLTGDALYAAWWPCPPLHLEQQHLPGTESVYFDLDNTPWVKCDKCHTPFIYSVGPGNQFMLSDPNVFFVLFFVVDSFRSPCRLCFSYSSPFPMSLVFQIPPPFPMSLVFCLFIPII